VGCLAQVCSFLTKWTPAHDVSVLCSVVNCREVSRNYKKVTLLFMSTLFSLILRLSSLFSSNRWKTLSCSNERPTSRPWPPSGLARRDQWSRREARLVCGGNVDPTGATRCPEPSAPKKWLRTEQQCVKSESKYESAVFQRRVGRDGGWVVYSFLPQRRTFTAC